MTAPSPGPAPDRDISAELAEMRREIRQQAREGGLPAPHEREHVDRPAWAYDEDGYCVDCGNGKWKAHNTWCEIAYLIDLAVAAGDPLYRQAENETEEQERG